MKISTSRKQRFSALLVEQGIVVALATIYHNVWIVLASDVPLVLVFFKLIDWGEEYQNIPISGDKSE